jgi:hypothetical protein
MVIEDAEFCRDDAWLTLLDSSEAFDSMDDQVTDITIKAAGLGPKVTSWIKGQN